MHLVIDNGTYWIQTNNVFDTLIIVLPLPYHGIDEV